MHVIALRSASTAALALTLGGCIGYERNFDRYSVIERREFERNVGPFNLLPSGVSRECVLERAQAISTSVGPEVQFFEGGYEVSQSGLMTRQERISRSWRLAIESCGNQTEGDRSDDAKP